MSSAEGPRAVCVVLHDVAPQTWTLYQPFVALADRLGVPLTLLVVPDFHGQGDLRRHADFVAALDVRRNRGDEIALHGYRHADDGRLRGDPLDFFMRRIYTREAEFYRLDATAAGERLRQGLAMFAQFGWQPAGFVAPAWLTGRGGQAALSASTLRYTSSPSALIDLRNGRSHPAPGLVWSARSPWRRALSQAVNRVWLHRYRSARLLRLGLHPVDMQHTTARRFWADTLVALLDERQAVTKSTALDQSA